MSALTGSDWNADRGGRRSTTRAERRQSIDRGRKLAAARDTLIVLSMQLSFRVTMFLRHLNY